MCRSDTKLDKDLVNLSSLRFLSLEIPKTELDCRNNKLIVIEVMEIIQGKQKHSPASP